MGAIEPRRAAIANSLLGPIFVLRGRLDGSMTGKVASVWRLLAETGAPERAMET